VQGRSGRCCVANALARQSAGHTNLLAVLTPNLAVKPATVLITKVTIKGMKQAVQMFGPAQAAVAKAVADSVAKASFAPISVKILSLSVACSLLDCGRQQENLRFQLRGTKLAIKNAMTGKPSAAEVVAGKDSAQHPFKGF